METVLLFGAGASFGAGAVLPHAPPLGSQLYPALVRAYPNAWGSLPADAAAVFANQGFEPGMAFVWQRYSQFVSVLQKAIGHYFAQFQVQTHPVCAYRALVSGLELNSGKRRVMLATLNYDLILDTCLQIEKVDFALGNGAHPVIVNKPHGACNLFNESIQATAGISFTAGVSFGGGEIRAVPQLEAARRNADPNSAIPPVLAIFMHGKPCQTSPDLLLNWQQEFKSAVLSAKRIAVVGVNPNAADSHIWGPLSQTSGTLFYCGEQTAFEKWKSAHREDRPVQFVGERFADCIDPLVTALKS